MITVVMLTTDDLENVQPFEVFIENAKETGLDEPSKIVINHPFTIFKELRLVGQKRLGIVNKEIMKQVQRVWEIAFDWE